MINLITLARVEFFKAGVNCKQLSYERAKAALERVLAGEFTSSLASLSKAMKKYKPIDDVVAELEGLVRG